MNLYQLLFALVSFTLVVPIHAQAESQARINVSLQTGVRLWITIGTTSRLP